MIKATHNKDVYFGISDLNIRYLKEGKPIMVNMKDLETKEINRVFIFYGKDESDMINILQRDIGIEIGPETKLK